MLKVVALIVLCFLSSCAVRKVTVTPPAVALQSETYIVLQTSPNNFTVLTRSKAAMQEIATRLGCDQRHICANQWNGEVWTIQRIK